MSTPSPPQDSSPPTRVAIVTGGAVRVGAAIVRTLARSGYAVWIHARHSEASARELQRELGDARTVVVLGALDESAERAKIAATVLASEGPFGGRLDLLVNNAASFEHGRFLTRTDADLERVLRTNLIAPISLARALAPALVQTRGAIVNLLDLIGLHPSPGYLDHAVAKAGLHMATRALAEELAPIRVNGVAPGTVLWPDSSAYAPGAPRREAIERAIPLRRAGTPEDIAAAVAFLAQSPYITGICLPVDGGRLSAFDAGYGADEGLET